MARTRKPKPAEVETTDDGMVDMVGNSGVVFSVPTSVASGLHRNGAADYVDGEPSDDTDDDEPTE